MDEYEGWWINVPVAYYTLAGSNFGCDGAHSGFSDGNGIGRFPGDAHGDGPSAWTQLYEESVGVYGYEDYDG